MAGWVKTPKEWIEGPNGPVKARRKFTQFEAQMDLLIHCDTNKKLIHSRGFLATRWKWNKGTVQRFLKGIFTLPELQKYAPKTPEKSATANATANATILQLQIAHQQRPTEDSCNESATANATAIATNYKTSTKTNPLLQNSNELLESSPTSKRKELKRSEKLEWVLSELNRVRKQKLPRSTGFRELTPIAKRQIEALLDCGKSSAQFKSVFFNAFNDEFHIKHNYHYITPKYITKPDIFQRYEHWQASSQKQASLI